jgi:glutaminyl-peptide cyclotransferase
MRIAITLKKYSNPCLLLLILLHLIACSGDRPQVPIKAEFDSDRAFSDLLYQVELGPRVVGSQAHVQVREWLITINEAAGWEVENQSIDYMGQRIHNIIAKKEIGENFPWVIIGAHYDSRIVADKDPLVENRSIPVPGANDGASGVAVLNELARVIPSDLLANIWLVYFDAEDNGGINGGEWILGSRAFVENLESYPDAVVILDMIGDIDLNIFMEKNSDINLTEEIWAIAESSGYGDYFISEYKHRIIDDHLPFMQAGIPAVDIIDFDYPYWHTISDTPDKVSSKSLEAVGNVVINWLMDKFTSRG